MRNLGMDVPPLDNLAISYAVKMPKVFMHRIRASKLLLLTALLIPLAGNGYFFIERNMAESKI
jgi:hypothetical protein